MVTLQAKQQQQQQHQPQRQSSRERVAVVIDEDDWNRHDRENGTIGDYNGIRKNEDDWEIKTFPVAGLKIDNGQSDRTNEIVRIEDETSPVGRERVNGEVTGSNGESTQCSDLEDDDEGEKDLGIAEEDDDDEGDDSESERSDRWIRSKVVTTRVQQQEKSFDGTDGQNAVLPHIDDTTFGQVAITNSQHVHVGNTNFYKGPVTIKQFVYTNAYPVNDKENGHFPNHIEANCSGRVSDINPNDVPVVQGDPNGPILSSNRDYESVTRWLWTWRCAAILCVTALSLVTIVAVASVLLTSHTESRPNEMIPETPTSGYDPEDNPDSVHFVERPAWGAQPPTEELDKLTEVPTPYVIISHTASEPCFTQGECVFRVRTAQTYHIESYGWSDIAYNFLVGGDGQAYVGRGWDAEGAHTFGWNRKSIGISFIGTFNTVKPNAQQLHAAKKVIELGVELGKISPTYKLLGHRQCSNTLSPGEELYKILTTWDHWSPKPPPTIPVGGTATTHHLQRIAAIPVLFLIIPHLTLLLENLMKCFFMKFSPPFIVYDKVVE